MPKSTVSCPSTLDERAASAAKYQRDVELAFSLMESRKGEVFDLPELPIVRDAFKHVAMLPWMHHMLTAFAADEPVCGLRLPCAASWTCAGAFDYEPDSDDGRRTVVSRLWLRAGPCLHLWITQKATLVVGTDLGPRVVYNYDFHLKAKAGLQMDVVAETMPATKELMPMDGYDIQVSNLAQIIEGCLKLIWLRQQED